MEKPPHPKNKKNMAQKVDEVYNFIKKAKDTQPPPKRTFMDIIRGKKNLKKEYKLPKTLAAGARTKLKKNYALIFLVRNNGMIVPKFEPIENEN